jgi:hypothetical protein
MAHLKKTKVTLLLFFLIIGSTAVLFLLLQKYSVKEVPAIPENKGTLKIEEKSPTGFTGTYGMLATAANSSTLGDIDWLVTFLSNYPKVTPKELEEYNLTVNSLHTRVEDFNKINPIDLNAWWQSTYYLLTSVIKNQDKLVTNTDLSKLEASPLYKEELINQMKINKEYLLYTNDVVKNFITAKYPDMYYSYPEESVVGTKFVGLPEIETPPHYPYFGIPIDIDRDNKLEMVFYTSKFQNRTPHYAYIVKDDVIIYKSEEGASVLLVELDNPNEKGFYLTEDNMDLKNDNNDRIYTKYSYKNGVISKVSEEIRVK